MRVFYCVGNEILHDKREQPGVNSYYARAVIVGIVDGKPTGTDLLAEDFKDILYQRHQCHGFRPVGKYSHFQT